MIDLNNLNKDFITKERLLDYVDPLSVFTYYIGQKINLSSNIISPIRKERNPSFGFFIGVNGELCFKDFASNDAGDFVKLVQLLFKVDYYTALCKIALDFNLEDKFNIPKDIPNNQKKGKIVHYDIGESKDKTYIGIRSRPFRRHDKSYWKSFNISLDLLKYYRVKAVDYIFINDSIIKMDLYAYAYEEYKDNLITYKIYQPFNKKYKWFSNHDYSVWQGWEQLDERGDLLIITSSLKDVMSIKNTTGINSVALQSETTFPKVEIINELIDRFKAVYVLYDNDFDKDINKGQVFAKELCNQFNVKNIVIPSKYRRKDFSDLVAYKGAEYANNVINNLIYNNE